MRSNAKNLTDISVTIRTRLTVKCITCVKALDAIICLVLRILSSISMKMCAIGPKMLRAVQSQRPLLMLTNNPMNPS